MIDFPISTSITHSLLQFLQGHGIERGKANIIGLRQNEFRELGFHFYQELKRHSRKLREILRRCFSLNKSRGIIVVIQP
jgi:hypothetical protein